MIVTNLNNFNKAFTLIEILLAVFILSLLMAAVIPALSGFNVRGIKDDARLAASIIRYLQETSQNTKKTLSMVVDLDKKIITYERDAKVEILKIDGLHSVKLTSMEEKVGGEIKVFFPATGCMERLAVKLNSKSGYMEVIYNPFSGRVIVNDTQDKETNET